MDNAEPSELQAAANRLQQLLDEQAAYEASGWAEVSKADADELERAIVDAHHQLEQLRPPRNQ